MRIVSGEFKGRRFNPPAKNWPTRPTTDFAKEALFNVLNNKIDFDGIRILDLFAGSGSLTFEFISRGCTDIVAVERHRSCAKFITSVVEELQVESSLTLKVMDVFKYIKIAENPFDLIFADPPYDLRKLADIPSLIFENNLLKQDGFLILEHDRKNSFQSNPHFSDHRKYGNVEFSFFKQSSLG